MSGAFFTLTQDGHAVGTSQRCSPLANVLLPFLTSSPRVGRVSTHTYFGLCTVQYLTYIISQKMYIIFYIRHTQNFNEYTKFYTFNVYKFLKNVQFFFKFYTILYIQCIQFFNECTQFCRFKVYRSSKNTQFCYCNVI